MTHDDLLKTASALHAPPPKAIAEYANLRDKLAGELNRRLGARSDLDALIGPGNRAMMEDNHRNHARFMESLFRLYSPQVLVETVLWVFRAYRAHGFRLTYWPAQLDTWVEVLRENLSTESFRAIEPFYHWMIVNQPAFAALTTPEASA
jgi:hypothetical protein